MKHLKTFFAVIAMLVLTFTFAACGTNTDNGNNADTGNNGSITESGGNENGSSSGSNDGSGSGGNESESGENTGNENPSEGESNGNESQTPSEGDGSGDGQDTPDETEGKILVVYFSATNNTESVAQKIQTATGADIYEIIAAIPYTAADLNYNTDCRANREQNDPTARPEINGSVENMSEYDTVFIGYPIWWGTLPKIIYTFMDTYDLSGKKIVPFCTSGGSGISTSVNAIKSAEPNATVLDGRRFYVSVSQNDVNSWVNGLGL